ncbi:hypothetical protein ACN4EK_05405 [Pantanalinema rosaneae CENA516]|uniref:hypothetical protein n=1 Tax=Pantanalinema rosaneae TaxID=1620701 RepID=UPI003D6E711F
MIISWEYNREEPPHILYYVDDFFTGEDNAGFDKILEMVRLSKDTQATLKINYINSLGGDSLINSFPFRDRFDELRDALGQKKLIYEFK